MDTWIAQTFGLGEGLARGMAVGVALLIVLVLIALFVSILKRLTGNRMISGRSRQPRIAIMDAANIDTRRRLLLVRRDNVEHLILVGGANDIVVEPGIVRGAPIAAPQRNGQFASSNQTTGSLQSPVSNGYATSMGMGGLQAADPVSSDPDVIAQVDEPAAPAAVSPPPLRTAPSPAASRNDQDLFADTPAETKTDTVAAPGPTAAAKSLLQSAKSNLFDRTAKTPEPPTHAHVRPDTPARSTFAVPSTPAAAPAPTVPPQAPTATRTASPAPAFGRSAGAPGGSYTPPGAGTRAAEGSSAPRQTPAQTPAAPAAPIARPQPAARAPQPTAQQRPSAPPFGSGVLSSQRSRDQGASVSQMTRSLSPTAPNATVRGEQNGTLPSGPTRLTPPSSGPAARAKTVYSPYGKPPAVEAPKTTEAETAGPEATAPEVKPVDRAASAGASLSTATSAAAKLDVAPDTPISSVPVSGTPVSGTTAGATPDQAALASTGETAPVVAVKPPVADEADPLADALTEALEPAATETSEVSEKETDKTSGPVAEEAAADDDTSVDAPDADKTADAETAEATPEPEVEAKSEAEAEPASVTTADPAPATEVKTEPEDAQNESGERPNPIEDEMAKILNEIHGPQKQ